MAISGAQLIVGQVQACVNSNPLCLVHVLYHLRTLYSCTYPLIGLWRLETPNPKIQIYYAPELFVVNFSPDKPIHQSIGNFTAHLLLYGFVD